MVVSKKLTKLSIDTLTKSILDTSVLRQSGITLLGTFLNGLFGAFFYILAARVLGPSGFGLISVAILTMTLISDIGDLGTNTGIINFVPRYLKENPEKSKKILKLGLEIKFFVSLFALVFGLFFSGFIARIFFVKPELTIPLKIAFVGVGASLFFSFIISTLQAKQKFWEWSAIQVATNALRFAIMLLAVFFGFLSVENTMWIYVSLPFLGFLIGLFLIKEDFLRAKSEYKVFEDFFAYNKWVAAFTFLTAIGSRLDTFITARFLDSFQVGIYSAANELVKVVPQIVVALGAVIAPEMASIGDLREFFNYLKKIQIFVLCLALLGVVSIPFILRLIPIIFGIDYIQSGPIFNILLIANLIFLISVPVHMATLYYFSFPKLFFFLSLAHLFIIGGLGWLFIRNYGIFGAATTVLVGQIVNFIIPAFWVMNKIKGAFSSS